MYLDIGKFSILSEDFGRNIYTRVDWIIRRKGGSRKWTERSTKRDRYKIYRHKNLKKKSLDVVTAIVLKQLRF